MRWHAFVGLMFSVLALNGCNNGSNTGRLALSLTDAPVDNATSVVVDILSITATPVSGAPIRYVFPQAQQIDLLQLQQGVRTPLISNWNLPPGDYQGLSLAISANGTGTDSYIVLNDGTQHALVPQTSASCSSSCTTTNLQVKTPFTITAGSTAFFTLDFDARKSVLPPATGATAYVLFPMGRITNDVDAANIIGVVPSTLVTSGCTPAVYAFTGAAATPSDINDTASAATQPLTESAVTLNSNSGEYDFTLAYLPPATYTLAFTCQAAQDNPATSDAISFSAVLDGVPALPGQTVRILL